MRRQLCFVLMPFDQKRDAESGDLIDFDRIYTRLIDPAIADAGLRAFRSDEELQGGIFHKRLFERLSICEYAIADLSHANANVFYELGIRHARRPWSTILLFQQGRPLPLDVAMDSAIAYPANVLTRPRETARLRDQITQRLLAARERTTDSPFFQLITGLPVPEVDHRRVDAMLESVDHEDEAHRKIAVAKKQGLAALREVRDSLGDVVKDDPEVAVTLLLAFRSRESWIDMVGLVGGMTTLLAETLLVQEQYALALSRLGKWNDAHDILKEIARRRPSPETYGLLGGVYKRQWEAALKADHRIKAEGLLKLAERTYRKGFEADWRDPYPGVNALTLRAARGVIDAEFQELLHVVRYSVRRRLSTGDPEYWDYASSLQLAVLAGDHDSAAEALQGVVTLAREPFEASTTLEGLGLLAGLCQDRGDHEWLTKITQEIGLILGEMTAAATGESQPGLPEP